MWAVNFGISREGGKITFQGRRGVVFRPTYSPLVEAEQVSGDAEKFCAGAKY
jgi:hypothetical protein